MGTQIKSPKMLMFCFDIDLSFPAYIQRQPNSDVDLYRSIRER